MKTSIITTNFNTDKYLEQTIKSILSQKGEFDLEYIILEYIITDGGSKDNSLEIIKKYDKEVQDGKWGERVTFKYLSEKDSGQSDGINKGLKMATGDIVAFLNADDLYTEGALEKVVTYFKDNPDCLWLTGYCRIIDENNKEIREYITKYKNKKLQKFSLGQLLTENAISQPSTFWRKSLMDEIGYLDESLHYSMDQDYWARMEKVSHMHLIKEYLAEFRFTSDTKTGSSVDKTLAESKLVAERYANNKWVLFRQWVSNLKRIIVYKGTDILKKILGRF
jgi:glycosyltransferase involved in cell wall biosynthesis